MRYNRREFLKSTLSTGALTLLNGCTTHSRQLLNISTTKGPVEVNDIQSQLNRTTVSSIVYPSCTEQVAQVVWHANRDNCALALCGGRHSMGGQQFATNSMLLDTSALSKIVSFDRKVGTVTVEAGIQWPALIEQLHSIQANETNIWSIREKQTGVDRVSIGGSVTSNIHGRGMTSPPFISDIESLRVVTADGKIRNVSRSENQELFSLICGGYGLFGIITEVTLRLVQRRKVKRVVEIIHIRDLIDKVNDRIAHGFLYGDCQYAVDLEREPDSYPGVFSCYIPIAEDAPVIDTARKMSADDWSALYSLLRRNKHEAFKRYSEFYMGTDGQHYWSDTHQLAGDFFLGYQTGRDRLGGSELILEVYVRPEDFLEFMISVRKEFLARGADVTFGTIRFIKRDTESFLAWASDDFVCIVCNLHVMHTENGIAKVASDFRALIDQVLHFNGSYYLTYHRFARPDQLVKAYPQFYEFLKLKKKYDPSERFQNDWYRHYRDQL